MLHQSYHKFSEKFQNLPDTRSYFYQINQDILLNKKCQICTNILTEPIQTDCGCRFCHNCITDLINTADNTCPNCNVSISKDSFHPDKAMEKEIAKLQIKCLNEQCDHVCLYRKLDDHLTVCKYRRDKCDKCQGYYLHNTLDQHLTDLCRKSIVKCDECGLNMTREDLEMKHKNINMTSDELCPKLNGQCPYKCCLDVQDSLKLHLVQCSHRPMDCPLRDLGCYMVISEKDLSSHIQNNTMQHQTMMMDEIVRLKNENISFKSDNESMKQEMKVIKELNGELINILDKCRMIQNENIANIENIKSECYKKSTVACPITNVNELFVINGECTWIIKDVRQKIREAKSGIQTQIFSDPFYIHRPGYKMCMKIFPNGDGRGKDDYLSVYFVILKGDYDEKIPWPFKERIVLKIISNKCQKLNMTVFMKPDNNEPCYGKPISNTNLGAGQPQFIRQSELLNSDNYVSDGSIELRLKFD